MLRNNQIKTVYDIIKLKAQRMIHIDDRQAGRQADRWKMLR